MLTHVLYGVVRLPFWGYAAVTFLMIQLMLLGVTLYLHRDQSHGGLCLHPILRHFFRFWLWFSSGTITREWVAVHRRHHAFVDLPGDPHSPKVFGLKRVLLEGYELYAEAASDPKILANYGRGTPDDWLERNLYGRFSKTGLSLFVVVQLVLFGVPAILMLGVQLIAQPLLGAGVINGFGHRLGYRSFEISNAATNILPWGVLICGEELHNNHHAFPSSPRFAVQAWEVDVGWLFIRLFRAVGLARVGNLAPVPTLIDGRTGIDTDTVRALCANRLHVLRDFQRLVIRPVIMTVTAREGAAVRTYRSSLLVRHPKLLDERSWQELCELLHRNEVLRTVVDFRDRLQHIWDDTYATPGAAVEQLRQLCALAEDSSITALKQFAGRLRCYTPTPAST